MPPSPPPDPPQPRQEHDPTLIQVDPDSVSLESLLQRLDAARASAMATINARADALVADDEVEEAPPLASHLDDLAADTLAQRHAARRQRELEWDERDTIDRRARALFSSLGPGRSVAPLYLPPTWTTGGAHDDHVMHDHEDEEDAITSMSYSDDGMDDGWAHGAAAAAGVGDDDGFHIAGFDGDVFGGDSDGESFDDEPWRAATTSAALAPRDDFLAMLPGFAGERPLNPPHVHVAPSAVYAAPSPVPRPTSHPSRGDPSSALSFSSFLRPGATFVGEQTFGSLAREARSRSRTRRAPVPVPVPAASSSGAAGNPRGTTAFDLAFERFSNEFAAEAAGRGEAAGDVSTAHPAFAPQSAEEGAPRTGGSLRNPPPPWRAGAALSWDGAFGPSSSLAIPRPAAASSSSSPPGGDPPVSGPSGSAGASGARSETSPLLALMLGRSSPSSRYAPYSATSSTAGTAGGSRPVHAPTATHPAPPVAPSSSAAPAASATSLSSSINVSSSSSSDPAARARARVAQSVNPAARTSRSSWGEVGEELLLRAVARERERERERGEGRGVAKGRGGLEDERWGVKVTILSYDPELKSLTGVMRAHGVAIPASTASTAAGAPPPPVGDVTTFFSGSILHPILDGLFCSPSPTGSGSAGGGEFHVTRASEAESWVQLGPFKGLAKGELLECAKSRTWVEERTRGWVLFRWKERDFVNVTAKESSLSISGFYHVVLNRQTGEVEGLYHDPAATPHQRLVLSPADNDRGAFGLGSFAYR